MKKSHKNCTFIRIDLDDLPIAIKKREIGNCLNKAKIKNKDLDLVYKSVNYGIVVNSKPYFMKVAASLTESDLILWVDAGISRFYKGEKLPMLEISSELLPNGYFGIFDCDFRNLFRQARFFTLPINWIKYGSSHRVISGGLILVRSSHIEDFYEIYMATLMKNLSLGYWDTEQVNLYKAFIGKKFLLLPVGEIRPVSILQNFNVRPEMIKILITLSWATRKLFPKSNKQR